MSHARTLGELCEVISGGTPARAHPEYFGGDVPWVKIGDLLQGTVITTEETLSRDGIANSAAKILPAGTVLVSIFATIGRSAILGIEAATNQAIAGLIPKNSDELSPEYLRYFLDASRPYLERVARGVAQPNINQTVLKALVVPLRFPAEQARIVDLLSRAENIVQMRREAEMTVKESVQALFLDMFGDPVANPKGWEVKEMRDVISDAPKNGIYKHASLYGEGTPILRIDSFYDGVIENVGSLRRVRISDDERRAFALRSGDIVINRVNSPAYLGKSAIVQTLNEPTVFESNMMRLRLNTEVAVPEYVIQLLQQPAMRRALIVNAKHAINQSSINQTDVKRLLLVVPPVSVQETFIVRLRSLLGLAERQRTGSLLAVSALQSLLHEFFGEHGEERTQKQFSRRPHDSRVAQ